MNIFTPLAGGLLSDMFDPTGYPLKFYGEAYTRPSGTNGPHPYPNSIGYIQGFVPLMDAVEFGMWKGPVPMGPEMNSMDSQVILAAMFPDMSGGLRKVTG